MADNGSVFNGNNKIAKYSATVAAGVCLALLTWNFTAVQSLQVQSGGYELRISSLRSDLEEQRRQERSDLEEQRRQENLAQAEIKALLTSAQLDMKSNYAAAQAETRAAIAGINSILTDLRIRLGTSVPRR